MLIDRRELINDKYGIREGNERSLFGKVAGKLGNVIDNILDTTKKDLKELDRQLIVLANLKDDKEQKTLSNPVKASIVNGLCGMAVMSKVTKLDDSGLSRIGKTLSSFSLVDLTSAVEQYMNGNKQDLGGLDREFNNLEFIYENPKKYLKGFSWYNLRTSKLKKMQSRETRGFIKRFAGFKDRPILTQQVISVVNDKITFFLIYVKGNNIRSEIVTETVSDKFKEELIKDIDVAFEKTSILSFAKSISKYVTGSKFDTGYLSKLVDNVDKLDLKEDGSQENLDRKIFSTKIIPTFAKVLFVNRKMNSIIITSTNKLIRLHLGIYKAKDMTIKLESDQLFDFNNMQEVEDKDEQEYNEQNEQFNDRVGDLIVTLGNINIPVEEPIKQNFTL
jgi:hypothetical protein